MARISVSGSFRNIESFLRKRHVFNALDSYGRRGVEALRSATPVESGLTANSWFYKVSGTKNGWEIAWYNSNSTTGAPVAILLQMGHGTGTGGYVQGRDYINPAMRPIFDELAEKAWKAVTSA